MLAVSGFLEDGRFTPLERVTLPKRMPVMMIFNEDEESKPSRKPKRDKEHVEAWLKRLDEAIDASMHEELPDLPPRQPMRPPLDFGD
jgi:hypothetical protein